MKDGLDFLDGLALLFIGLRLAGVWMAPWWVVTSPIWVTIIIGLIIAFTAGEDDDPGEPPGTAY